MGRPGKTALSFLFAQELVRENHYASRIAKTAQWSGETFFSGPERLARAGLYVAVG